MKKIMSVLLSFAIILSFSPRAFAAGDFESGSGTENDPYVIKTLAQLQAVSSYSDSFSGTDSGLYYSLEADITDALDTSLCPNGFTGNFDGNGHTIHLGLKYANPDALAGVGFGLFGINNGTISDLNVAGSVTGSVSCVGAIAGQNAGTITGCTSSAKIEFISDESVMLTFPSSVGGIAGQNDGTISNCSASGSVNVGTGNSGLGYYIGAGGLVGINSSSTTVSNSSASGTVSVGTNDYDVNKGGLIGRCDGGNITNCYATGDVPASSAKSGADNQGGLIGYVTNSNISISNCYATGDVTGGDSQGITRAGGLIGYDATLSAVSNCYATGRVSASLSSSVKKAQAGGLIGYLTSSKVQNCYSTGSVTGTASVSLGGLIGTVNSPTVTGCYWNTSTSGVNSGSSNSGVGIGLTTAQMTGTAASTNMPDLGYGTNFTAMENTSLSWYYPQLTALCGSTSTKAASLASVAITTPAMTALSVSSGKISPNFVPDTTDYSVAVVDTVSSITLTPTISISGATIQVNGNSVSSGSTSGAIDISGVSNTITITVTSSNGTYRNYNLTVTKLIPVTGITAVPTAATVGTDLTLSGTVAPTNATNQTITWSVKNAGTTGATISGNKLSATASGTATVTATITDGTAPGTNYMQDFDITVGTAPVTLQSIAITKSATKLVYTVGDKLDLTGLEVTGIYSDKSTKAESVTAANVSGFDSSAPAASQKLTVTVGGKTASYTVQIKAAEGTGSGVISEFSDLTDSVKTQSVALGTAVSSINLPKKLKAVVDGISNVFVSVTKWVSSITYNPNAAGTYDFTPVLDSGYQVKDSGVHLPHIRVTVQGSSSDNSSSGGSSSHHSGSSSSVPILPSSVTDTPTHTTADLSGATFPPDVTGATLSVTQVAANGASITQGAAGTSDSQAAAIYNLAVSSKGLGIIGTPALYNIKLLDQNGNAVTFTGSVQVKIPLPAGLRGTPHVFRYEESTKTFTDMNAKVEDGYLIFATTHFSYYTVAGVGDSITLDTSSYQMPIDGHYQIGVKLTGTKAALVKVCSTSNKAAAVTKLANGNYQVTGKGIGTAYIMFDVYDSKNKLLTHASVRVDVKTGIRSSGNATRQIGVF